MKKRKIGNIIFIIIFSFIVINTMIAYFSYKEVSDNKEPKISFKTIKNDDKTIYNELLYKVVKQENENKRTVSLKLFFLD